MAFAQSTSAPQDTAYRGEKAVGFLNIYLPTADGQSRKKVGAIPLKGSVPAQKFIADLMKEDPENGLKRVLKAMDFEYVEVSSAPADGGPLFKV